MMCIVAGVSCATRLLANAVADSVHIFEKSRGSSGRMSTRRGDDWACDHGAQYFTATSPSFAEAVQGWVEGGVCRPWEGRLKVYNSSGGWDNLRHTTERFVGVPKMKSPVEYMLKQPGITLHTSSLVEELRRVGVSNKWDLRLSRDGGKSSDWIARDAVEKAFDIVVLAAPSPQTYNLVKGNSAVLADVSGSAEMRGCWAVIVRLPTSLPVNFDGAFINEGRLSWIALDSSKPGRPQDVQMWLLHGTMKWSEDHIEANQEDVAAELIEEFARVTGCRIHMKDIEWSAHRWRYATTHPNLDRGSVWDADKNLGICGDWLDVGKVEGAWKSGVHLAEAITRSLPLN